MSREFFDEYTTVDCNAKDCIHHKETDDCHWGMSPPNCLWLCVEIKPDGSAKLSCHNYEREDEENVKRKVDRADYSGRGIKKGLHSKGREGKSIS